LKPYNALILPPAVVPTWHINTKYHTSASTT
jgi:hypothetical protein